MIVDVLKRQTDNRNFLVSLVRMMSPGSALGITVPANDRLWSHGTKRWAMFVDDNVAPLACLSGLPLEVRETSYLFPEMVRLAHAEEAITFNHVQFLRRRECRVPGFARLRE